MKGLRIVFLLVAFTVILGDRDARAVTPRLFATSSAQGIVELDPATGTVVNILQPPVPISVFDAMAFDGQSLFFLNHGSDQNNIYELDPDSGTVIATHPFAATSFMEGMAALNGQLYVMDRAADNIVVFDPDTNNIVRTLEVDEANPGNPDANLSGGLAAMTTGGDGLIASTFGDSIVEIDPASGQIVHSFTYTGSPASGGIGLGALGGEIFVGNNTGLTDQIIVYTRTGLEQRRLTVPGSIGIQSIGADDVGSFLANLIFPQYADGEAAGFRNKTRVVLIAGDEADSGEIRFFNESGAAQSLDIEAITNSTFSYSLQPHGTLEIATDGSGALKRGPLEVYSDRGSGSQIKGSEVFELLGHSVSVPNAPPRTSHLVYINFNEEEQTAIAAYNPDRDLPVVLQLSLLDTSGTEQATAELELTAGEQKAKFLNEPDLFGDLFQGGFRGSLLVTSATRPVCLLSLIQKKQTGALIVVDLN